MADSMIISLMDLAYWNIKVKSMRDILRMEKSVEKEA